MVHSSTRSHDTVGGTEPALIPQTSQELSESHNVLQFMSRTKYIQTVYAWNCMLARCVSVDLLSGCAKIVQL